jgi:hypothetical protein
MSARRLGVQKVAKTTYALDGSQELCTLIRPDMTKIDLIVYVDALWARLCHQDTTAH